MVKDVSIHKSVCRDQMTKALTNGCFGLELRRNGGQAVPSIIEKEIGLSVKQLREQNFPVFPDDVIMWAAEAIAGTDHASYFPECKPTRG